ncbi:hypothetical protein BH11ARM1_BH11ARM1_01910 [soil metagenome]
MAFAWVGLFITAPFVIISEVIVGVGFFTGLLFGFYIAAKKPAWFQKARPESRRERPERPPATITQKVVLTLIVAVMTYLVYDGTSTSSEDKGPFFFMAMFLLISISRRTLRKVWGFPGSLAGMLLSGGLLVLLIRSAMAGPMQNPLLVGVITIPLVFLEAFDEVRSQPRSKSSE